MTDPLSRYRNFRAIAFLCLIALVPVIAQVRTQIDAETQIKNLPPPSPPGQVTQSTHLTTVFEPSKRVPEPGVDQPCALGSWAVDGQATRLFLCLHENTADSTFRWRVMTLQTLAAP